MSNIILYHNAERIGRCDQVSIEMNSRTPIIDITSLDSQGGFREFISGAPSITLHAVDIEWDSIPEYMIHDILRCQIFESGVRIATMDVLLTEQIMERNPISDRIIINATFQGTGEIQLNGWEKIGEMERIQGPISANKKQGGIRIIKSRLHEDDNSGHTTTSGKTERTKESDSGDFDESERGFRIIP